MGWSIGYDNSWKRDIGYGVPAFCDHPGCMTSINGRGAWLANPWVWVMSFSVREFRRVVP